MFHLDGLASLVFALGLVRLVAGLSTRNCLVTPGGQCESTDCLGSDWGCHNQTNTQVGGAGQFYRIRNAREPSLYLELRVPGNELPLTRLGNGAAKTFQWTLMKLPTKESSSPLYMMFTERRPEFAMTHGDGGCGFPFSGGLVSGSEPELNASAATGAEGAFTPSAASRGCNSKIAGVDTMIQGPYTSFIEVAMKLTRAPVSSGKAEAPLVMISFAAKPGEFLWGFTFSGNTHITDDAAQLRFGDPGAGGYWFFDPPLPSAEIAGLPAFSGPPCSDGRPDMYIAHSGSIANCGKVGDIKSVGQVFINAVAQPASVGWACLLSVALLALGGGLPWTA